MNQRCLFQLPHPSPISFPISIFFPIRETYMEDLVSDHKYFTCVKFHHPGFITKEKSVKNPQSQTLNVVTINNMK